uniref:Alanine--tRNA ligase n=1 Tax=candidate division WOR-3 bacterium TaxID=2052148 RepID=A0A7C4YGG3_UNCW3
MWNAQELRNTFIKFFKDKGHKVVPSSSLIPEKDPTLLFTSAGMVQFKPFWSGEKEIEYPRATSIQKCLRLSDIDRVGDTPKHDTFFEMLGNFSFGDYFKKEAISFAYEFIFKIMNIDLERMVITIHPDDEESLNIWKSLGIKEERIFKTKENFWGPAGGSGPCGPCTEMHFDLGKDYGDCNVVDENCERFIEVWNLVFPQFNYQNGEYLPLKNKGVDTGMGLERLAMVMQEKKSIFETDLFYPLIKKIEEITGKNYDDFKKEFNILADHIRALTFAISDGAYPSNEGRGYVLRRILRRGVINLHKIGMDEPTMFKLVPEVVKIMKGQYPELEDNINKVSIIIKSEEERFLQTLQRGLEILDEFTSKNDFLSGEKLFLLYDTYGFPPDLVQLLVKKEIKIDFDGFEKEMEKQREKSRRFSEFKTKEKGEWIELKDEESNFVGYEKLELETEIIAYRFSENKIHLILKETPFYAESGGQIGDKGIIEGEGFRIIVEDTQKEERGNVHIGLLEGEIKNPSVYASVDKKRRKNIMRNHTSTHILHKALKIVLGDYVKQEGSLVSFDRLRFDFSHPSPLNDDEIKKIEEIVNGVILDGRKVIVKVLPFDDAIKEGAVAIFGEKYGDIVRLVEVDGFSKELCGGTHTHNTMEILGFKIVSEKGIAAGIRRIEAITGEEFIKSYFEKDSKISFIKELLKTREENLVKRIEDLIKEKDEQEKILKEYEKKLIEMEYERIKMNQKDFENLRYVVDEVGLTKKGMRELANRFLQDNLIFGILMKKENGNVSIISFSGKDAAKRIKAQEIIMIVSKLINGGGGGKDNIAEGGGKNIEGIKIVKERFERILQEYFKGK